jgi:hypothetical protein
MGHDGLNLADDGRQRVDVPVEFGEPSVDPLAEFGLPSIDDRSNAGEGGLATVDTGHQLGRLRGATGQDEGDPLVSSSGDGRGALLRAR